MFYNIGPRGILRVAHPTIDVLQLYANQGPCVKPKCGLDVYYLEYIANNLHKDIRQA